ncbi:uncharacterized protein [Musca autumnalis]|uniref:uncharacterized protein n=1 Tax=Musca autumnalis TaxID=221902 RepID=UPI003CEA904A
MSNTNEDFSTPIQKKSKRLGLKRNSSNIQNSDTATKTTPVMGSNVKRKATADIIMEPQSDVKINYRNLENDVSLLETGTPSTPILQNQKQLIHRECVSTNCRPYRLSLSRRIREKMTKKRLEFHLANEMEKQDEEQRETASQEDTQSIEEERLPKPTSKHSKHDEEENKPKSNGHLGNMTREELLSNIEKLRHELKTREDHTKKVQDLKQAIEIWKNGFAAALNDLQQKITPHYDKETLLQHLHIPKEMLKFVND